MTFDKITAYVAEKFGIEPNEDGKFDLNDYDWTAGCSHDGVWLNLAKVVYMIDEVVNELR